MTNPKQWGNWHCYHPIVCNTHELEADVWEPDDSFSLERSNVSDRKQFIYSDINYLNLPGTML
jgi:hypothetical protein